MKLGRPTSHVQVTHKSSKLEVPSRSHLICSIVSKEEFTHYEVLKTETIILKLSPRIHPIKHTLTQRSRSSFPS